MKIRLSMGIALILFFLFSTSFLITERHINKEKTEENWEIMRPDSVLKDFQKVLAGFKGKVVYVDFWASWCGPCMQDFRMAAPVKEAYSDKDVVFLYISLDESLRSWAMANQRLQLTKNSFVVPNLYTSSLVKNFRINTIPRYLIYNKQGILVKEDAPPPGSSMGIRLLDKYLKK